ncbi:MAG: hypothetical protein A2746_00630 [Candidatus Yanofskybacteria bacterium RIFCSPHIGHO2_01_FULL_44_22]|nr:MAG: hypothetical protein A2746_00630 [Candidatus Yanofskybacteria bacterium RIFCSPHIGHO2_01_FULL_44_22]
MGSEPTNPVAGSKKLPVILAVAGVIVAAGLVWWWLGGKEVGQKAIAPTATPEGQSAETADINADLNEINAGDLDAEFNQVDQDLNSL